MSAAANQDICSMDLPSADTPLMAFSCFTEVERGLWALTNKVWVLWPAGPGQHLVGESGSAAVGLHYMGLECCTAQCGGEE